MATSKHFSAGPRLKDRRYRRVTSLDLQTPSVATESLSTGYPTVSFEHCPIGFAILRSGGRGEIKGPIVEQWNLTLERDLGRGVGVRAS